MLPDPFPRLEALIKNKQRRPASAHHNPASAEGEFPLQKFQHPWCPLPRACGKFLRFCHSLPLVCPCPMRGIIFAPCNVKQVQRTSETFLRFHGRMRHLSRGQGASSSLFALCARHRAKLKSRLYKTPASGYESCRNFSDPGFQTQRNSGILALCSPVTRGKRKAAAHGLSGFSLKAMTPSGKGRFLAGFRSSPLLIQAGTQEGYRSGSCPGSVCLFPKGGRVSPS